MRNEIGDNPIHVICHCLGAVSFTMSLFGQAVTGINSCDRQQRRADPPGARLVQDEVDHGARTWSSTFSVSRTSTRSGAKTRLHQGQAVLQGCVASSTGSATFPRATC